MGGENDPKDDILEQNSPSEEKDISTTNPAGETNLYIQTVNNFAKLVNEQTDCIVSTNAEGLPVSEGVCEHLGVDVNNREISTHIKIRGKMIHNGLNIQVVDPESGYEVIIFTSCIENECPEGLTQMDRSLQLGDIEIIPNKGIGAYFQVSEENPGKISAYILKGESEGELNVQVHGESIGKILSPGLSAPIPINMGEIDEQSEFLGSLATITPDGKISLNQETLNEIEKIDGIEEEVSNTIIQREDTNESCSLTHLLNSPGTLDPTQTLLAIIALSAIINKLR